MKKLKDTYFDLLKACGADASTTIDMWSDIVTNYSRSNRYYHNLSHLDALLAELHQVRCEIVNWRVILFTLYYHDVIYSATKKNNEEKSADFAVKIMSELGIELDDIKLCQEQILATKHHTASLNQDTNYFTDADLSILGKESLFYETYCYNVRKEYSIYPDFMYRIGRRRVVKHFLAMDNIFKTEEFYARYESQARINLRNELNRLNE